VEVSKTKGIDLTLAEGTEILNFCIKKAPQDFEGLLSLD
jgi:hypothetical protein